MRMLARIITVGQGIQSRLRNLYFRMLGVKLLGYVWMRQIEIPRNHYEIEIAAGTSLDQGVVLLCTGPPTGFAKIRIGARTYINRRTMLDASHLLEIGSDCAIGPGCYLTDHDHGIDASATPLSLPLVEAPTRLGNGVWLGAHVVVLKGITIGDGAVVGAGSLVTKDIPARAMAVGVPARVVRVLQSQVGASAGQIGAEY